MPKPSQREAIAKSPEAKTHPGIALAAIDSGMTLEQFQRMARAADAGPGEHPLARAMRTRTQTDNETADAPKELDIAAIYERRRAAVKA